MFVGSRDSAVRIMKGLWTILLSSRGSIPERDKRLLFSPRKSIPDLGLTHYHIQSVPEFVTWDKAAGA